MNPRLVLFANELDDYIVIITDDTDPNEYKECGYIIIDDIELALDPKKLSRFPTDRPLHSDD